MSKQYRTTLKRRILAGRALHMELLWFYYVSGKPPKTVPVSPPPGLPVSKLLGALTVDEQRAFAEMVKKMEAYRGPASHDRGLAAVCVPRLGRGIIRARDFGRQTAD